MRLRVKSVFITGVVVIAVFLAACVVLKMTVLNAFLKAGEEVTLRSTRQALKVFDQNAMEFGERFAGESSSDDAYQFVADGSRAFIDSNLNDKTVQSMKLHLIVFVDLEGKIVFSTGFDPLGRKEILDEALLKKHFSTGSLLMRTLTEQKNLAGILILPRGPMIISSRPILNSRNEGPPRGTLIDGRYLDENQVKRLSLLTDLKLSIYRPDDALPPPDIEWARFSLMNKRSVLVRPMDEETIASYVYLEDIYGEPRLILKVEKPRDVYRRGEASAFSFLISMIFIGLIFMAVTLLLLERIVLSRVYVLNASVNQIRKTGKLSTRVPVKGKDELSNLAESINVMLQSIQSSHEEHLTSKERFEFAVRGSSDGLWDWDLTTNQIYYSPRYKELLGYEEHEFEDALSSFESHLHPEDRPRVFEALKNHLEKKSPYNIEYRLRNKKGEYLWCRVRGRAVWDPSTGKALRIAGSLTDITERNKAEMIIRENERRMRTLLENVKFMAVGLNADGRIEYVNPHFLKLTGYSREELLAKYWFSLFIPEAERYETRIAFKEFLIKESPRRTEAPILTKAGHARRVVWNHTLLRDDVGRAIGTLSLGEDITEITRLQQEMIEADKAATVAQLAAGAAHEVKNPLAILLQAVEFLSKTVKDKNPEIENLLKKMEEAIRRADNIVKGLLDLSRPSQLDVKQEDLNSIIDHALSLIKNPIDRKRIHVVKALDPLIPRISLDKDKIIQALINILGNALDAMPEGAVLSVKTGVQSVSNLVVAGGREQSQPVRIVKQIVTVEIADSGPGIPENLLPNIFKPFFTTKRGLGGTGLGLSVVKNIMKIHEGAINVCNRKEGGTLVTL